MDYLQNNGFEQYEISNFCKENYQCLHNLHYWELEPYYAFGPAAHGFDGNKNKRNAHSIFSVSKQKYIYLPPASQFTHPALIHNQRSNSFCSTGDNDDPSQTLPSAITSSVSQFSSPQVNWERSHSSSNLNNSNANKFAPVKVDTLKIG